MNRNLDAEIVERIFGWILIPVSSDYYGENACEILYPPNQKPTQDFYNTLPRVGKVHKGYHAPGYSGDLRKAIELCKHVKLELSVIDMPTNPEVLAKYALDWWDKTQLLNPNTK